MRYIAHSALRLLGNAIPINPVMDKLYRSIISLDSTLPQNSIVTVPFGRKFRVFRTCPQSLLNNPDYYIYYFGIWEPRPTRALLRLIRSRDICFDIGANIGWYTLLLSKLVGWSGQVHAFEPDPRIFALLLDNIDLNQDMKNIYLNEMALGHDPGTFTLYGGDILVNSSLYMAYQQNSFTYDVTLQSIDNYVTINQIKQIDFIKCDVEGSEFTVLQGAEGVLKETQTPPMIQLEINPWTSKAADFDPKDLLNWLQQQRNYHFYRITLSGKLREIPSLQDAAARLSDIFCLIPTLHADRLAKTGIR